MRKLIGKRLHQFLYDQKISFRRWRVRTKRESKLIAQGIARRVILALVRPLNSIAPKVGVLPRPRFLIGPTNSANQGSEWSRSLTKNGAASQSLRISSDPVSEWFITDLAISREEWLKFPTRQKLAEMVARTKDVVLFESLRPMFRLENIRNGEHQALEDIELIKHIGKRVGVIFHGSDIRDVDAHAARTTFSPFNSSATEITDLRKRSNENRALLPILRNKKIPIFVSTQDLFHEVPDAIWLPVVVDFVKFNKVAQTSPIYSQEKLRVLYLPSRSWLKSADLITPVLEKLHNEGVIEFIKPAPVPHDEVPSMLAQADVVIDQFLGALGVFAIEALAAGRLAMTYLEEGANSRTPLPASIINMTPQSIESEIRSVALNRPLPAGGVEFAKQWHDGTASARIIGQAFGWKL